MKECNFKLCPKKTIYFLHQIMCSTYSYRARLVSVNTPFRSFSYVNSWSTMFPLILQGQYRLYRLCFLIFKSPNLLFAIGNIWEQRCAFKQTTVICILVESCTMLCSIAEMAHAFRGSLSKQTFAPSDLATE